MVYTNILKSQAEPVDNISYLDYYWDGLQILDYIGSLQHFFDQVIHTTGF